MEGTQTSLLKGMVYGYQLYRGIDGGNVGIVNIEMSYFALRVSNAMEVFLHACAALLFWPR